MKKEARDLLQNNKGFSAIQNIKMIVFLSVLVCVAIIAFYGYIATAYDIKVNDTAKAVFESASSYMEKLGKSERLVEFNRIASHFGGIVSEEQQKEILASLYTGTDFEEYYSNYKKKYKNTKIRYIKLDSIEIEHENRKDNPIFDFFEYTVLDENILDNTFLIEYNGSTGEVLSVLYSEKTETFSYVGDTTQKSNVILRNEESLKNKWQGYSGKNLEEY
ncbi:MAG: hypothetical protein ACRC7V_09685 [Lachnospiraceae bacterium]